MSNVYLYRYNNYYNRQVKKLDSLSAYATYLVSGTGITNPIQSVNFNPNDGVDTELILNWNGDIPDYLIISDDNTTIASRWFVIEATRTRSKQFKMTLHRDVIVDNYTNVLNAPTFIEKATLNDDDPMIYNKEDLTFNQIKQSETLLKDETNCAWIVGYMGRKDISHSVDELRLDTDSKPYAWICKGRYLPNPDEEYSSISAYETAKITPIGLTKIGTYYDCITQFTHYGIKINTVGQATSQGTTLPYYKAIYGIRDNNGSPYCFIDEQGWIYDTVYSSDKFWWRLKNISSNETYYLDDYKNNLQNCIGSTLWNNILSYIPTALILNTIEQSNQLLAEDGKILKIGSSYYKVHITQKSTSSTSKTINNSYPTLYGYMQDVITNLNLTDTKVSNAATTPQQTYTAYAQNVISYAIDYELVYGNVYVEIPFSEYKSTGYTSGQPSSYNYSDTYASYVRPTLLDAPYDMFCIPYSDELTITSSSTTIATTHKDAALSAALGIGEALSSSGYIYDIQLLPYCPVRGAIKQSGTTITFDIANMQYGKIYSNSEYTNIRNVVLFATQSDFTFDINYPITIINKKLQNQTDLWRLCSPNYNGVFDFNAAMNNGNTKINVDCTYKPYTPYIHLNPIFKNLYGYDFNDARGLICGGDYSLPVISDAWKSYEYNNKNYQNIFNRQIQNLETNQKYQRINDITSALSGTASGAMAGGLMTSGNPMGIVGGAVISGAAGIGDLYINDQLRKETIDYTKDLYSYNLGNIQAQPQTLGKIGAINSNNKIFPFVEYYTCTDIEKEAFQKKLTYNGMTVMRIGKIADFIQDEPSYIKGKIIRLENISDDFHTANIIAEELNKGVYI